MTTRPIADRNRQCEGLARPTSMIVSSGTSVVPEGENVGNCPSCFGVKATISMSCPSSTMASTGTAIGRLPKAEKTAEIDHDHDLAIAVANQSTNPTENVLALDRTRTSLPRRSPTRTGCGNRIAADSARLMPGGGGMPPGVVLCAWATPANRTSAPQDRMRIGTIVKPLICPRTMESPDSQYPPGYVFVTSMAVTHFGFL